VKRKLFWWVLAIGLLVLAMLAMKVVEGRSQDLVPRAYLPLVMREYEVDGLPPRPTLTPTATATSTSTPTPTATATNTPTPTATSTPGPVWVNVRNCTSAVLHYEILFSGEGMWLYPPGCVAIPYMSALPAGTYTWYAESSGCGVWQAAGEALFTGSHMTHKFTCVDGVLTGDLIQD